MMKITVMTMVVMVTMIIGMKISVIMLMITVMIVVIIITRMFIVDSHNFDYEDEQDIEEYDSQYRSIEVNFFPYCKEYNS